VEQRDPVWQAVFDVLSFESDEELLDAIRAHEVDQAVVALVEDALRRERDCVAADAVVEVAADAQTRMMYEDAPASNLNWAIDQATNTRIGLPAGCFDFPVGAYIVAVEVVSVVRLTKFTCDVTGCPRLPLWPSAPNTRTRRSLPDGWCGAVKSARSWY
jgi:hypothetical protein